MSPVRKFQFDESFDTDIPAPAAKPKPEPETPPEPPPAPTFSEEELAATRTAAFAEGKAVGHTEGHAEGYGKGLAEGMAQGMAQGQETGKKQAENAIENRIAAAIERLAGGVDALLKDRAVSNAMRGDQPVHIALATVGKLMPELTRRHGLDEIEGTVRQLLGELVDEPRLLIAVTPDLVEPLRERLQILLENYGFSGKLGIVGEPDLPSGDCRIEWADGGAERDTAALVAAIRDRMAPLLDHPEALASSAAESSES